MTEVNCSICFTTFETGELRYTCADHNCQIFTCVDCIELLIEFSEKNNNIPECPSPDCKSIYILSGLKKLPQDVIKKYNHSCLKYIMKSDNDIHKYIEADAIVKKIRKERLEFLKTRYPKGIFLVANIVFKNRLNKLNKQKKEEIKSFMNLSNKICFNITCNGHLNKEYKCMICDTEFCEKCENIKTINHVCKKADIASLDIINDMRHCPKCNLPIFKYEGCDAMTCPSCKTNFQYSTGEIWAAGNHSNYKLDLGNDVKLLSNYLTELIPDTEIMELILKFESLKPTVKSNKIMTKAINDYTIDKDTDKAATEIAKKINILTKNKIKIKQYNKILVEIEKLVRNSSNVEELKEQINNWINIFLDK